jgi:hypothetical protein
MPLKKIEIPKKILTPMKSEIPQSFDIPIRKEESKIAEMPSIIADENKLIKPVLKLEKPSPLLMSTLFGPSKFNNSIPVIPKSPEKKKSFEIDLKRVDSIIQQSNEIKEKEKKQAEVKKKYEDEVINKRLSKLFNNYLLKVYSNRLNLASKMKLYYDDILYRVNMCKKYKILYILKNQVVQRKSNQDLIRELVKRRRPDDVAVPTFKTKFYTYHNLRDLLISKNPDIDGINHMKIVIYTQKKIFHSTHILQTLFEDLVDNNLLVEEDDKMLNIYDKNYKYIINGKDKIVTLIFSLIFIDKIDNIANFIHDHQNSLNKFTYGIIMINFTKLDIINKLFILLDYSLPEYKEFILINHHCKGQDQTELFKKRYNIKNTHFFYKKKDDNTYMHNMIEYYNNCEFLKIFESDCHIQTFMRGEYVQVNHYFSQLNLDIVNLIFKKELYASSNKNITQMRWIKWFIKVNKLLI